jgi:hypothetical protein
MTKNLSTYEKGLALELRLAELFKKMGYHVTHDAKKVGLSGAEHQIDVLAEYNCPLHISKIIVEAKSYDKPIDKDRIMKLMQIVTDLGADRGIIVTTSYFTPEAVKTATGHNVELWDREQLARLLGEIEISASEQGLMKEVTFIERAVRFNLSIQDAQRIEKSILEQRAKGGFLGAGKINETLESISLQYLPYYEAEIQTSISENEKTGLLSKRTVQKVVTVRTNLNGQNGDLVTVTEEGLTLPYPFLKRLSEEDIRVFKIMQEKKWYSSKDLSGLGISEGKTRKILSILANVGAVKTAIGNRGVTIYQPLVEFPNDPRLLKSISDSLKVQEVSTKDATFISPSMEASDVMKRLECYWNGKVNNLSILYFPCYICTLTTQDGSKRTDVIDATSGKLIEF